MADGADPPDDPPPSSLAWGEMTEIESLCMRCYHPQGKTRLMGVTIPHFRELILSSFECPKCGETNRAVQFGGKYGENVVTYELRVASVRDINRQVVKSEHATLRIPEIDLEVPPESQPSSLNTVEGVLQRVIDGLLQQQPLRRQHYPETATKIDAFIERVRACIRVEAPFTVVLTDVSGNSYIESTRDVPSQDPQLTITTRERTNVDNQRIGLSIPYNSARTDEAEATLEAGALDDGVATVPTACHACSREGHINIHRCDIPHFREVVIIAFRCEHCGYKSSEVKTSGEVPPKGKRLTLHVRDAMDLKRDVLKSDTASVSVPELQLELAEGTLGSFFSTVEGVIAQIRDKLGSLPQVAFASGDSAASNALQTADDVGAMDAFLRRLDGLLEGSEPFTLILDDPLGHCFIQNARAHLPPPQNVDEQLEEVEYTRTDEQDEELGLHDMRVD